MENARKLGIMICRKTGKTCTGAGCFKVLQARAAHFEPYKDEELQIAAFFDCSGCDADKETDPGFLKKMRRLKENEISLVHLASCIKPDCPQYDKITAALEANGITYVAGTH